MNKNNMVKIIIIIILLLLLVLILLSTMTNIKTDEDIKIIVDTKADANITNPDIKLEETPINKITKITTECHKLDNNTTDKVTELYKNITTNNYHSYRRNIMLRQEIEILKIPIFIELTKQYLKSGHSIVIFVNYMVTVTELYNKLYELTPIKIDGYQSYDEIKYNVMLFQTNKSKVIICFKNVCMEGLTLEDYCGLSPRLCLISPSCNIVDIVQSIARVCRKTMRSDLLIKILFCDNTIETRIKKQVHQKLLDYPIASLNMVPDKNVIKDIYNIDNLYPFKTLFI